jgi:hypothetical protein
MPNIKFSIESWAAWAPQHENQEQWRQWAKTGQALEDNEEKPALDFLPAMFRRRLSQLSKAGLQAAFDCLAGQKNVPSVFVSRHGEMQQLVKLITALNEVKSVSPAAFSLSVHNTTSGLFSIANENVAPSTALAGGEHSLEAGFLEALGILQNNDQGKVLLVIADEYIHEIYRSILPQPQPPVALAFLLTRSGRGTELELTLGPARQKDVPEGSGDHALEFMRWFLTDTKGPLVLAGNRFDTIWTKHASKN